MNSHYLRIRAANPAIAGRNHNDAVTGADMADLLGQVQHAVAQQVEYVTVLMGANDVCASSEGAMTPVATFRAQFEQAMAALAVGLPTARVFVASIPNVYNLFAIYRGSFAAQSVGRLPASASRCSRTRGRPLRGTPPGGTASVSGTSTTTRSSRRSARAYVMCRFDNNAVFNTPFARSDVTTRDYFHPSVAGQTKLAAVTWAATFDFASG